MSLSTDFQPRQKAPFPVAVGEGFGDGNVDDGKKTAER